MDHAKPNPTSDWMKFLNPDSLKGNLIACSLFLAAYETLKSSVIKQIRGFYTLSFDANGRALTRDAYKREVVDLHKKLLPASILWLRSRDVINDADVERLEEITIHRNEIVHQLPELVMTVGKEVNFELLTRICELVTKIDTWWILNFEVDVNPDFDGREINASEVHSGNMIFLQMLTQIAAGEEPTAYLEGFQRLLARHGGNPSGHKRIERKARTAPWTRTG